jgi:hypothetical protein
VQIEDIRIILAIPPGLVWPIPYPSIFQFSWSMPISVIFLTETSTPSIS